MDLKTNRGMIEIKSTVNLEENLERIWMRIKNPRILIRAEIDNKFRHGSIPYTHCENWIVKRIRAEI